jgi:hypothetical protein
MTSRLEGTSRLGGWRVELSIFAALMVLFATWAIGMPLFTSPDEAAHLYKAYGTAHGELLGATQEGITSNTRIYDVPAVMGTPDLLCYFGKPDVPAACAVGHAGATASTAAVYPPPWYLAVGIGPRVLDQSTHQRAYRISAAVLVALLMTAAFALARRSAARRWTPLLLISLPPMTVFLSGTVNPNAFEIAGFMVLWSLLLHVDDERATSARSGALVGALTAGLALSRFASLLWLVVAVVLAVALLGGSVRRFLRWQFLAPAGGVAFGGLAVLGIWSRLAHAGVADQGSGVDWSTTRIIRATLDRMPELSQQMIGVLGWLDTRLPGVVFVLYGALTLTALAGVVLSRNRHIIAATVVALIGLVAVPVFTHVMGARTAGLIWQGRYSLPLYASLGVLGMLGWHRTATERTLPAATPSVVRVGAVTCFAVAEVLGFWQALRRYTVGADGRIVLTGDLPWQPDVAPVVLQIVNALAVAALCAVLLRSTSGAHTTEEAGVVPVLDTVSAGPNGQFDS